MDLCLSHPTQPCENWRVTNLVGKKRTKEGLGAERGISVSLWPPLHSDDTRWVANQMTTCSKRQCGLTGHVTSSFKYAKAPVWVPWTYDTVGLEIFISISCYFEVNTVFRKSRALWCHRGCCGTCPNALFRAVAYASLICPLGSASSQETAKDNGWCGIAGTWPGHQRSGQLPRAIPVPQLI